MKPWYWPVLVVAMDSCTVDSVVVRQARESGGETSALAGAAALGGNEATNAGGSSGTDGANYPIDPYHQDQYDWCQPPVEDTWYTTTNPSQPPPREVVGSCSIPQTQYWSVTLLVDRSLSMNERLPDSRTTKWVAIHHAIEFLSNEPTGFVQQLSLMTFAASDAFETESNCNVSAYQATPSVYQHPPKLNVRSLMPALEQSSPTASLRPTGAALRAAIVDARTKSQAYGGDSRPMVVLLTDGSPYGCASGSESQQLVDGIRAEDPELSANFVPIHVVQLGNQFDLTELAKAGGTPAPYVISGGQVDLQLVKILRRILFSPPAHCDNLCSIAKPSLRPGAQLDFAVTIESAYYVGSSVNSSLDVPQVGSSEDCATSPSGGFWVTDSGVDYSIGVCPCTCAAMGSGFKTTANIFRFN
ncbi:MAG TPA: vWA domain-containing protein [Polyangiaceae bacterium]